MKKNIIISGLTSLLVTLTAIGIFSVFNQDGKTVKVEHIQNMPGTNTSYNASSVKQAVPTGFNETVDKVISSVVHIKSTQVFNGSQRMRSAPVNPFRDFFGDDFEEFFGPRFQQPSNPRSGQPPVNIGTGSGVIINQEGYIVTNNHVVASADDIEVTLHDNRTYKASVVGTDPSTDLALLQIKEKDLPALPFINSDEVEIGQWVLAVGNPLGLNSTVTAGIVSAKGRSINILKDRYAVENFIQTDAAINPGNSGGALVDLNGGLVGINTAIASPTGTFAGYGFAVPANIVNKVVEDLLQYGVVQRGVLGIMIRTVDGNFAKENDLKLTQGVYVDSLMENSAAATAGLQAADIITAVNERAIKTSSELQGMIARYRPGESVTLTIDRNGKQKQLDVILNNRDGHAKLVSKEKQKITSILGATFETIDSKAAKKLDIDGGVKVKSLTNGKLSKYTQMREGFIITHVDGQAVSSVEELLGRLKDKKGGVMFAGVYEDIPGEYFYAIGM